MSTCLSKSGLSSYRYSLPPSSRHPPPAARALLQTDIKMRCLQVPGWRAQNRRLDFSFYCCCCCCWPLPNSWCCPLTFFVFFVCWGLVSQAQLERPENVGLFRELMMEYGLDVWCGESHLMLTWWGHHPLPFLKQTGFQAVPWAETVRLVSGHQLLHGL